MIKFILHRFSGNMN
uniref:Uncharacterized protein n=1 Tax=Rhizophora mucronata TaxID=61149 RepID=A0A2P2PZ80_RHIMU